METITLQYFQPNALRYKLNNVAQHISVLVQVRFSLYSSGKGTQVEFYPNVLFNFELAL